MKTTLRNYSPGQVIFRENTPGKTAYIIKEGKVEFSSQKNDNKTIFGSLGRGTCFGEIAILFNSKRSATATAVEPTILYEVDEKYLKEDIEKSSVLIKGILRTTTKRLMEVSKCASKNESKIDLKVSCAHIIAMQAKMQAGKKTYYSSKQGDNEKTLPYNKLVKIISETVGMTDIQIEEELLEMSELSLIKLDKKASREYSNIVFEEETLVKRTKSASKLLEKKGDDIQTKAEELIEISILAELIDVSKDKIYRKIGTGEIPEAFILYRKKEMLQLILEKGKKFFEKRVIKKVEDFEEIADIEFIDLDTLRDVLKNFGHVQIAKLLKTSEFATKKRILDCFSTRIKGIINDMVSNIEDIDDVEIRQLEIEIIDGIKAIKLKK